MAVAVDDDGGAGGDGATRERPVEIEVRRRAVDFDDRARLGCGREDPVVVEVVAAPVRDEPVGRMRDDGDHRVLHRGQIPALERRGRLAGIVVERRQDDVELLQDAVREIEPAIRKDVHLAAVQDLDVADIVRGGSRSPRPGARRRPASGCATPSSPASDP